MPTVLHRTVSVFLIFFKTYLQCVCTNDYEPNEADVPECVPVPKELGETCDETFVCNPAGHLVCDTTVSFYKKKNQRLSVI